jgi:hypothetical protein
MDCWGSANRGDGARAGLNVSARQGEVGVIEGVVRVCAQLQLESLRGYGVLVQAEIRIRIVRAKERVAPTVSEVSLPAGDEVRGREACRCRISCRRAAVAAWRGTSPV